MSLKTTDVYLVYLCVDKILELHTNNDFFPFFCCVEKNWIGQHEDRKMNFRFTYDCCFLLAKTLADEILAEVILDIG